MTTVCLRVNGRQNTAATVELAQKREKKRTGTPSRQDLRKRDSTEKKRGKEPTPSRQPDFSGKGSETLRPSNLD